MSLHSSPSSVTSGTDTSENEMRCRLEVEPCETSDDRSIDQSNSCSSPIKRRPYEVCDHTCNADVIYNNAIAIAESMGLNAQKFKQQLDFACKSTSHDNSYCYSKPQRVYTLEFLQALMEKTDVPLGLPKIGSESPKVQHASAPKGKYKPKIQLNHGYTQTPEENTQQRDIVRSNIQMLQAPSVTQRGENAWIPTKSKKEVEDDPVKVKLTKLRSHLNKISPDNEQIISDRICEEIIEECVCELIPIFFDKGVWEQKYREIYARLCIKLSEKFPGVFMSSLLKHTRHEFETRVSEDEDDDVISLAMKRRSGAIYFIVEMLKVKLLKPEVVVLCINKILRPDEDAIKSDYDVCHTAEMLIIAVPIIKNKETLAKLGLTLEYIKKLHTSQRISQRVKFKIDDAVKVFGDQKNQK